MNTAQKVRLEKQDHPERFCVKPGCLWRTRLGDGTENPCRNHPHPLTLEQKLQKSIELAEMQKTASP